MKLFRILFFSLFIATSVWAQTTLTRGPYLQVGTPQSMVIRWKTNSPTVGMIRYGTNKNNLIQSISSSTISDNHEIKIEGLVPYTKYYYAVYGDNQLLTPPGDTTYYFITSPAAGLELPIHIWVIGDFGRNNAGQKEVRDAYWNSIKNNRHTDVWLWLGDNAYGSGTDMEFQNNLFNVYPHILRNTVSWPCPGNHDYNSISLTTHDGPYYRIFTMPKNGEAGGVPSGQEGFYSFDYGNIHFVSLNSEWIPWTFPPNNEQIQWLHQDLSSTTQTWKIVFWHKPPYSKGSHDSDNTADIAAMRANFVPIMDQYGVDLVLNGHSHNYERTHLIKGHYGTSASFNPTEHIVDVSCGNPSQGHVYVKYIDENNTSIGTIYCVVGNSGSVTSGKPLNHPAMCSAYQDEYGSLVIDVNGNELHARYFTSNGIIKDEFKIIKLSRSPSVAERIDFLQQFNIFPNPFSKELHIVVQPFKEENITMEIIDLSGKVIATIAHRQKVSGVNRYVWQADHISGGMYMIKVTNGHDVITKTVTMY